MIKDKDYKKKDNVLRWLIIAPLASLAFVALLLAVVFWAGEIDKDSPKADAHTERELINVTKDTELDGRDMGVIVDTLYGCEYIYVYTAQGVAITPRNDIRDEQVCKRKNMRK